MDRSFLLEKVRQFYKNDICSKNIDNGYISASGKIIDEEDLNNMIDSCLDMWITSGRYAEKFEKDFCSYLNVSHCHIVNSGSSANLLALTALTSHELGDKRLKKGDEVITVAAGFPTTIAPIIQNGMIPVFIDIDLTNYNYKVDDIEKAISSKTRAIFMAHTLGNPFDLDKVMEIARKYDLWVIEDSCDALGAKYNNKYTGTIGHIGTFSFYPAHHITMGEGGAVVTNDPKLSKIIKSLRDWGRDCICHTGKDNICNNRFNQKHGNLPFGYDHKYVYSHLGYNLKVTDIQAALGVSQLKKISIFIKKRNNNFMRLYKGLIHLNEYISLPETLKNSEASWFGFPITVKENNFYTRNHIVDFLEKNNIGTRLLFAGNILKQPVFVENDYDYRIIGDLKNTDVVMNSTFWIGVWPGINEKDIDYIIDKFNEYFCNFK